MSNFLAKYQEAIPKLKEELGLENDLAVPRIEKIVINTSVVEAIANKEVLEKVKEQLAAITGQKPAVTQAKKAIANFKLQKGDPIGLRVTLRGKRAWHFLERLIAVIIPRIRDFRGLSPAKFDKFGNYSLGLTEQTIFPEINFSKIDRARGLVITIVIKNSNPEKSRRLLELLGAPFKKI